MDAVAWGRARVAGAGLSGVVVALLCAALWVQTCQHTDPPKIDPKTQTLIDSLRTSKPSFEKSTDSIVRIVVHDTIVAHDANAEANRSLAHSQKLEAFADSLAQEAVTHADSALLWRSAYDARTLEADTLKIVVMRKDMAYRESQEALIELSRAYYGDSVRRVRSEALAGRLQTDIAKLTQPCRFGPLPCPSRTVTMVASGVLGALAVKALKP